MILDTSAVVAVIRGEPGREELAEAIETATKVAIGTPTAAECSVVLVARLGEVGRLMLSRFFEENAVIRTPFNDQHWSVAADAFIRCGKGRHAARLNSGDCMTYATARVADEPLLFVGDDFAKTDVRVA